MSKYKILQFPEDTELLKRKGIKVTDFGPELQTIIDNMFETLYSADKCAALAATQLDIPNAPFITVIDFSEKRDSPLCLINAEIIEKNGETNFKEACMSVNTRRGKSVSATVKRAETIVVKFQDREGKEVTNNEDGFMAKCIQHELDHLHGILYIDYLKGLKRKMLERKILS
jgi:peptide deformylase|tara:strand:+ start:659 stop:1174 length:516 start_codon:yes stop_codon:yes gene_type:complete